MRERKDLVVELISDPKAASAVLQELSVYGWYCEKPLATITKQHVLAVLKRFEHADFSAAEIQAWANAVGGRTDIGFEFGPDGCVEESLYWLAHPELNGAINSALCERIVALYERRRVKRVS
ncbi:MAG: hypothetical protein B7Y56_04695 [Gallionellales bacterium 35-53-114]|jgi:hypothetical protein|nr:MAG: hypothetical protein B7Y56_04695 [Gallionellales bacterium 35-53-114]OYZ65387.1 MAG: hypothetical protein B7Y04_01850 [Gallionellales bacterium 24-53-125]OZB08293.1 MAG: hypothetical protein B7X61_12305 [Gallionellales bacterium 39-52-133]HQS58230.1 hypothetical protein [Gallionellaceae bacterium]HQS73785.1 hypothetical protein [Gallionellaceae bacterium]